MTWPRNGYGAIPGTNSFTYMYRGLAIVYDPRRLGGLCVHFGVLAVDWRDISLYPVQGRNGDMGWVYLGDSNFAPKFFVARSVVRRHCLSSCWTHHISRYCCTICDNGRLSGFFWWVLGIGTGVSAWRNTGLLNVGPTVIMHSTVSVQYWRWVVLSPVHQGSCFGSFCWGLQIFLH